MLRKSLLSLVSQSKSLEVRNKVNRKDTKRNAKAAKNVLSDHSFAFFAKNLAPLRLKNIQ